LAPPTRGCPNIKEALQLAQKNVGLSKELLQLAPGMWRPAEIYYNIGSQTPSNCEFPFRQEAMRNQFIVKR
jgi:hypothetical protein